MFETASFCQDEPNKDPAIAPEISWGARHFVARSSLVGYLSHKSAHDGSLRSKGSARHLHLEYVC